MSDLIPLALSLSKGGSDCHSEFAGRHGQLVGHGDDHPNDIVCDNDGTLAGGATFVPGTVGRHSALTGWTHTSTSATPLN